MFGCGMLIGRCLLFLVLELGKAIETSLMVVKFNLKFVTGYSPERSCQITTCSHHEHFHGLSSNGEVKIDAGTDAGVEEVNLVGIFIFFVYFSDVQGLTTCLICFKNI